MKLEGLYEDIWELVNITNKKERIAQFKYLLKLWKGDKYE